tara:strand:- start:185 stop:379 length:195 start_codon:yes stop_codon:yes gene_type:complete
MNWSLINWLNDNRKSMQKREEKQELLRERLWCYEQILSDLESYFSMFSQISREDYEKICSEVSE